MWSVYLVETNLGARARPQGPEAQEEGEAQGAEAHPDPWADGPGEAKRRAQALDALTAKVQGYPKPYFASPLTPHRR